MFWVIIGNLRSPRGISEASFGEVPSGPFKPNNIYLYLSRYIYKPLIYNNKLTKYLKSDKP